jgi:hypothetical protein
VNVINPLFNFYLLLVFLGSNCSQNYKNSYVEVWLNTFVDGVRAFEEEYEINEINIQTT